MDKVEEAIRGSVLETRTGPFLDKIRTGHFTRGGVLETRMGSFLEKITDISIPNHGGGNYPCLICGDQSNLDGVITSCLDCFLAGGNLYLFEYGVSKAIFMAKLRGGTCTIAPSDPSDEVISRANFLFLLKGFGAYHLLENNCEDFAIYCKTGLVVSSDTKFGSSGQVNSVSAARNVVGAGSVANLIGVLRRSRAAFLLPSTLGPVISGGIVLGYYGKYCFDRMNSDVGVRNDVCKIPVEKLAQVVSVFKSRLDNKTPTFFSEINNKKTT